MVDMPQLTSFQLFIYEHTFFLVFLIKFIKLLGHIHVTDLPGKKFKPIEWKVSKGNVNIGTLIVPQTMN